MMPKALGWCSNRTVGTDTHICMHGTYQKCYNPCSRWVSWEVPLQPFINLFIYDVKCENLPKPL
jgi:hypothetical protein